MTWQEGDTCFHGATPDRRWPKIVGIVNITEDSFSDGGLYLNAEAATEHALRLVAEGADVVDPGTRPLYHIYVGIYVGSKAPWFTITDSLTQFTTAPQQDG